VRLIDRNDPLPQFFVPERLRTTAATAIVAPPASIRLRRLDGGAWHRRAMTTRYPAKVFKTNQRARLIF